METQRRRLIMTERERICKALIKHFKCTCEIADGKCEIINDIIEGKQ